MTLLHEKELDQLIDNLNQEQSPIINNPEMRELGAVVRAVKGLRPPAEPNPDFSRRVHGAAARKPLSKWLLVPAAALVAGFLLLAVLHPWSGLFSRDIVLAMEQAVSQVYNYHGAIEMRAVNSAGDEWVIRQVEVWWDGGRYAARHPDGTMTVNNGERRWQIRPVIKTVAVFSPVPDPQRYGYDFNLREEAKRALQYPHKEVGKDTIAGRKSARIEISPPGGLTYQLWIDEETKLPLQLQTAMINSLQTTYTFVSFEANTDIDESIFTYQLPGGYQVVEDDPGLMVSTPGEAAVIAGFAPLVPGTQPGRMYAFEDKIVLDYGDTTVVESPAKGSFEPAPHGSLGKAGDGLLEVVGERLRWRQAGVEISIEGPQRTVLAGQIAGNLSLPDTSSSLTDKGSVKVPVNLESVKLDQQQVDGGHGPWQLDPLQVALTFVNLKVSPEGIQGEPIIPYDSLEIAENTGAEAVVSVDGGPVKKVYLKRLIRQDETGIWSVVGYDPR